MSNPKSILLFAAILPQFADPAAGSLPLQLFLLGMICVLIALVSDSMWALLAGSPAAGWSARRDGLPPSEAAPAPSWWAWDCRLPSPGGGTETRA